MFKLDKYLSKQWLCVFCFSSQHAVLLKKQKCSGLLQKCLVFIFHVLRTGRYGDILTHARGVLERSESTEAMSFFE